MNAISEVNYVFPPAAIPALPVIGSDRLFPVRRLYCVGRNYAEHAIEMGHDPNREPPFFFQKNPDSLRQRASSPIRAPAPTCISRSSSSSRCSPAARTSRSKRRMDCVFGYAVGLDMTRRDLQGEAKKQGRPWEVGKSFEASAPCGPIVPASRVGHPAKGAVWLDVNGKRRQTGDLAQLIWNVPETIAYLSSLFTLAAGDLIMTGTPAGVGAVLRGDVMKGGVEGIGEIEVKVV